MRRFLFLALLVLALPGCAANKAIVFKDGKPLFIATLSEDFVAERYNEETLSGHGSKSLTYSNGTAIIVAAVAEMKLTKHPCAITLEEMQHDYYTSKTPSSLDPYDGKRCSQNHEQFNSRFVEVKSFEHIWYTDAHEIAKSHFFFFPGALASVEYFEPLDRDLPSNKENLSPGDRAMLEEFSKRADAAFKGIRFAQ
jgi:hypothetical protein